MHVHLSTSMPATLTPSEVITVQARCQKCLKFQIVLSTTFTSLNVKNWQHVKRKKVYTTASRTTCRERYHLIEAMIAQRVITVNHEVIDTLSASLLENVWTVLQIIRTHALLSLSITVLLVMYCFISVFNTLIMFIEHKSTWNFEK